MVASPTTESCRGGPGKVPAGEGWERVALPTQECSREARGCTSQAASIGVCAPGGPAATNQSQWG